MNGRKLSVVKLMRRVVMAVSAMLIMSASLDAADSFDLLEEGNKLFVAGEFQRALESYISAESIMPANARLDYNIAGALYENAKYEEAVDKYTKALSTPDIDVQQASHYNLGNTHYRMGDYQKAITGFENALNLNPDDLDAKLNLELARKMLKEQMKPQEQQQDQQQEQEQKEQEQEQEEKEQGEDEQEKDQQDQQQQDEQQEDQQDKKDQQQMEDKKEMSKEDAERILNALRDDEKDLQKKIKRQKGRGTYKGKDW